MSDESRRRVLYYLRKHGGTADVDELREHLSKRTTDDPVEIRRELHHRTLPKLDDFKAIDYNQTNGQVRYEGDPLTNELLEWIGDVERRNS